MRKPKLAETPEAPRPETMSAPLAWIDIPEDRARSFDPDEATGLAAIIAETGLQHPIRLRVVGNRYRLVAGRKRLEAIRILGWDAIPYTVSKAATDDEARLEEVMENLGRVELNKLDRCQHLYELKQVYERLHPETKKGGNFGNQHVAGPERLSEIFSFSQNAAEATGLTRRAIEIAVKIWTDLTPESRKRLAGSRFADHQSGLKELSEQSPADQVKLLDMLLADEPKAATVAEAVQIIRTGIAQTPAEKKVASAARSLGALPVGTATNIAGANDAALLAELQKGIATLSKFFGKLKDDELDDIVSENEERILASLKRQGRI